MIEVSHLTRRYGTHTAVDDLSFTIRDGQIYGFLGPNGAGKSTTMNVMTGCLAATSGTVKINGLDIFEDALEAKRHIGYLPEIPPLYTDSSPWEFLHFVAEARKVPKAERDSHITEIMERTKITDVANRMIGNLSKGYRQRVGIAMALIGDPEVIILDEPTVGLDPLQIIEIRDLIRSLGKKHTVILSSHILSEVQAVCDEVLVISQGKLVACDTIENLRERFSGVGNGETTLEDIFIRLTSQAADAAGAASGTDGAAAAAKAPAAADTAPAAVPAPGKAAAPEKAAAPAAPEEGKEDSAK